MHFRKKQMKASTLVFLTLINRWESDSRGAVGKIEGNVPFYCLWLGMTPTWSETGYRYCAPIEEVSVVSEPKKQAQTAIELWLPISSLGSGNVIYYWDLFIALRCWYSVEVEVSLGEHPDQTGRCYYQWTSQTFVKLAVLEHKPFRDKMSTCHNEGPNAKVVHVFVADNVVGTVESDDGGQKRPGAKSSSA